MFSVYLFPYEPLSKRMPERSKPEAIPPQEPARERPLSTREALERLWENSEKLEPVERLALDLASNGCVRLSREAAASPIDDEETFVLYEALLDVASGKFPEPWHRNAKEKLETLQRMIDTNPDWYRMMVTPESLRRAFAAFACLRRLADADDIPEEFLREDASPDLIYAIYFQRDVYDYFVRIAGGGVRQVAISVSSENYIRDLLNSLRRRIEIIRSKRTKFQNEVGTMLSCSASQIATSIDQIYGATKAYVGRLESGIFDRLEVMAHVYAEFPEGHVRVGQIETGEMTNDELKALLIMDRYKYDPEARPFLKNDRFAKSSGAFDAKSRSLKTLRFVRVRVTDLGFPNGSTSEKIFSRARDLGLELCPLDFGPRYRTSYTNQRMYDRVYFGVETITNPNELSKIFYLNRQQDGLWLCKQDVGPITPYLATDEFVFCLPN